MDDKSLTDTICQELVDGLKTGDLNWTRFLAKYSASKGLLYDAIGRFFRDMEHEVRALNEAQARLGEARLQLKSLSQRIREADKVLKGRNQDIKGLEKKQDTLKKQIKALQSNLAQKGETLERLQELEKLNLGKEQLETLYTTLAAIGSKHGLKPDDAINEFFTDLQDYDTKCGFEKEIQRLTTITETKRLEAENWQAKAQRLESQYKNLKEAIEAIQALLAQGVKGEQIVSWNRIVSKAGGTEELQQELGQYKTLCEVLDAKKKETVNCEKKIRELDAKTKALNEQKAKIEAGIKSLSASGVKKIAELSEQATSGLKSLSAASVKEVTTVGGQAINEVKTLLAEIRVETKRLADLKAEAGKLEKELMYARYLVTVEPAVLKSFPKEVVISFLERASVYCELNELNRKVRAPDDFHLRYVGIGSFAEVSLRDLIAWAEAGLAGAVK